MKKKVLVVCLLLIVGVVLYSNTFRVPFTFDDYHSIVLNDKIHSWGDWSAIWSFSRARFLTYLTFALNYHFGGLHVTGYHLVNLLIHLSASIVLFFFVLLLTGTAFEPERSFLIAAVASLIFLIHPLQTQAVTYIVQRAASLATLCYLATLWLYLKYRLSPERKRWLYYCLALLVAVAGMFTKEICFTLPLMILMVNLISGKAWRRDCLPFLLTMAVVPALHLSGVKGAGLGEIGRLAEPSGTIGPLTYLFTQFRVLVSYLRLLLFPIKQNLDYDYPVYHSFLVPPVWGSFLLLAFLSGLGFYAYRKGQRFFSLAVAWFFVALAVESSIYPIADVIFEHRLYLAMPAYALAVALLFAYLKGQAPKFLWATALVLLMAGYSTLAYTRNNVWKSAVSLWQDVVRKSPGKARAHHNLGHALTGEKKLDAALKEFNLALKLNPNFHLTYFTRGSLYAQMGQYQKALDDFNTLLKISLDKTRLSHVYVARGKLYAELGEMEKALSDFNQAIRLDRKSAIAFSERGLLFAKHGQYQQAIRDFNEALRLNSHLADAYNNRGLARVYQGEIEAALMDFRRALNEMPDFASVYVNMGLAYFRRGDWPQALKAYQKALELNSELSSAYAGLALVYRKMGQTEKARQQLESALAAKPGDKTLLKALEDLKKESAAMALSSVRSLALSYCEKGNAFREKGDWLAAIEQYNLALKEDPTFAAAYYNRGRTYQELGKNEEALNDYLLALKYNPKDAEAWNNKGFLLDQQGKLDQAISDYSRAILYDRGNSQAYNNRGNAFFKKGEYEKAIADYSQALGLNPALAQAYRNRGMAYGKLKEYEKAALDFQKYLELNPDDPKKDSLKKFIEKHIKGGS